MVESGERLKPIEAWLNRVHPRARGLLLALPFLDRSTTAWDHARQKECASSGSVSIDRTERGPCVSITAVGTGNRITLLTGSESALLPTTEVTVVIGYRKRDTTLRNASAFGMVSSALNDRLGAAIPFGDGNVYWDFGGATDGTTRVVASGLTFGDDLWMLTAGPRGMEIWQNGRRAASNAATPTRVSVASDFALGGGVNNNGNCDLSDFWLFELYDRQMSLGEIAEVFHDPFALYRVGMPSHLPFTASASGPQSAALTTAAITLTAKVMGRTATVSRASSPASVTLDPKLMGRTATVSRALSAAATILSPQAFTRTVGAVSRALSPASVTLAAQAFGTTLGAALVAVGTAVVQLTAKLMGIDGVVTADALLSGLLVRRRRWAQRRRQR